MAARFKGRKVEISRFKGLGEMAARQLRETTMDPKTRVLERVEIDSETGELAGELVEQLMGRRPELRLAFIQTERQARRRARRLNTANHLAPRPARLISNRWLSASAQF